MDKNGIMVESGKDLIFKARGNVKTEGMGIESESKQDTKIMEATFLSTGTGLLRSFIYRRANWMLSWNLPVIPSTPEIVS